MGPLLRWAFRPARSHRVHRPEIILAPGPTPIPPEVLLAQGSPLVYHRGPGFGDLMRNVTGKLEQLYRTGSAEILLLTSTGVIQPVERLASVARDAGALVIVDVVSSLGAVPFEFDAWGIDVAIGGSQKALSASPGIAFVAVSERAWQTHAEATLPRYYFDWSIYRQYAELPDPENPWTPAISVMQGLFAPLDLYNADGVDAALARHRRLSRAVKDGVQAIGLDLFGEGLQDNCTVTAIRAPEGIDADSIAARIRRDFGVVLAPGQGPLKGTVFRIGHFGYVSELDVIRGLAALEMTLERLGHPVKRGAAVAAAEGVFQEAS